MVEFNPDGSIRLPGKIAARKADDEHKIKYGRCLVVRREIVSDRPPKSCALHISLSPGIMDFRFVDNIFFDHNRTAETPLKMIRLGDREWKVEVGTHFRRCTECCGLVSKYRGFIEVVEKKGLCTFNPQSNFCYEDYFD